MTTEEAIIVCNALLAAKTALLASGPDARFTREWGMWHHAAISFRNLMPTRTLYAAVNRTLELQGLHPTRRYA